MEEEINYNNMRYELDENGYVCRAYFGCGSGTCQSYEGNIPDGYEDLQDWYESNYETLNAWKIVNGNLTLDSVKESELLEQYEIDAYDNSLATHKELYGLQQEIEDIQELNYTQYTKATAQGKILGLENVKKVLPKLTIKNINCYSYQQIDVIVSKRNVLPNEGLKQSINGLDITKNIEGTLTIDGTSTQQTEYNLSGSSDNTSPIFVFKKDVDYYLSINDLTVQFYNYDGTDRELVGEYSKDVIKFSEDKPVTNIVLVIPSGEYKEHIIYPMMNLGNEPTKFEKYEGKKIKVEFGEYIEDGLFPSDTLFPSDALYPSGTSIGYILFDVEGNTMLVNGEEVGITDESLILFNGYNTIYCIQDADIDVEYCINNLALEGTVTKNNNFKILEDGSIEAHNGFFSGNIETDEDILVGNNLYVGRNKDTARKYLYFGDEAYIRRWTMPSGRNYIQMYSDLNTRLSCNDTGTIDVMEDTINMSYTPSINSDERLKQNIQDVDVSWIEDIKIKEFEYKNTPNKKHIGVIAQEYLDDEYSKYFLNSYLNDDGEEYYSIEYGNITNALIKYCQELKNKIDDLENRIKEMEGEANGEN